MKRLLAIGTSALLAACTAPGAVESAATVAEPAVASPEDPGARLADLFEEYDEAQLAMSPMAKAYRGIVDEDYGRWDDLTDAAAEREQALDLATYAKMRAEVDRADLAPGEQLSYDLFEYMVQRGTAAYAFRENDYIFDQMRRRSQGDRAVHSLSRSGDRIHDRQAKDHGTARTGAPGTW